MSISKPDVACGPASWLRETENKLLFSPSFVPELHSVFATPAVYSQNNNVGLFADDTARKYNFVGTFLILDPGHDKPDVQNKTYHGKNKQVKHKHTIVFHGHRGHGLSRD